MPERVTEVILDTAAGRLRGTQEFGTRSPELMQMFTFALYAEMTVGQAGRRPVRLPRRPRGPVVRGAPPGDPQPGSA